MMPFQSRFLFFSLGGNEINNSENGQLQANPHISGVPAPKVNVNKS
jgi:hypothetical protein